MKYLLACRLVANFSLHPARGALIEMINQTMFRYNTFTKTCENDKSHTYTVAPRMGCIRLKCLSNGITQRGCNQVGYSLFCFRKGKKKMSELKNGEFGIDMEKEKVLWTDRKRRTIFALPLSFTKYTVTESKLIIQSGCFNLKEDEIQLYRVRDIAFRQSFWERLCRVGSIHICSTDAMTPEIDIRRVKRPREVKELLSKTIEVCRKANGIRTSEVIGEHGGFPEPGQGHCCQDHHCQ